MSAEDNQDVTFQPDELAVHLTLSSPAAQDDHVDIILKWEKQARSAVVALGKLAKNEDYLVGLFSAACAIDAGDEEFWDDEEESK